MLNPSSWSKTVPVGSPVLKKYLCRFCPEAFSYSNIKAEQITGYDTSNERRDQTVIPIHSLNALKTGRRVNASQRNGDTHTHAHTHTHTHTHKLWGWSGRAVNEVLLFWALKRHIEKTVGVYLIKNKFNTKHRVVFFFFLGETANESAKIRHARWDNKSNVTSFSVWPTPSSCLNQNRTAQNICLWVNALSTLST